MQISKRASLVRPKSALGPKLQIGDKVCVELPEIALKEVQRGHGGWSMRMKEVLCLLLLYNQFELLIFNIVLFVNGLSLA